MRELVLFKEVRLEKDVSETDKYGRLLRYVYVSAKGGAIFVNEEMVRRGYAQVMTIPPDVKYTSLFVEAQREAQEAKRGLWGEAPKPQPEANIFFVGLTELSELVVKPTRHCLHNKNGLKVSSSWLPLSEKVCDTDKQIRSYRQWLHALQRV